MHAQHPEGPRVSRSFPHHSQAVLGLSVRKLGDQPCLFERTESERVRRRIARNPGKSPSAVVSLSGGGDNFQGLHPSRRPNRMLDPRQDQLIWLTPTASAEIRKENHHD